MRAARLLLAGVALLLVLAVGAIALVPPMLDWNQYRGTIAALASSAIGHPVRIEGAVSLTVLPEPMLTANGITVDDDGDGHFRLTARALRLRVALGPLVEGRIDARELVLSGAVLRLPWPLGFRPDVARLPAWLTGLQARIEQGRVEIGNLVLTGIEATLARDPLTGTLAASGTGTVAAAGGGAQRDRPWRFTGRLSPPGGDGSATVELSLDGQGAVHDTGGRFTGQMAADGSIAGQVTGRGADLSQILPAPVIPWQAEGRLSVAGGLALADDLQLDLGGSRARGAVAFRVSPAPRLDLALAASRLDLDRWLPVLLRGGDIVPTGIDLSAEAATLAGGTLQHLRAAFDTTGDAIAVREASATLPGDASLHLDGQMAEAGRRFTGALRLDAPDPATTLRWLAVLGGVPAGGLPGNAMHELHLAGRLDVGHGRATLADLHGAVDGTPLGGTLAYQGGARPALSAGLALDRLDLGPWLAASPGWPRGIAGVDLDLGIDARQAVWRGATLHDLALHAHVGPERVVLRQFEATIAGVHARGAGTIDADGRVSGGQLDLTAADIAGGAALIPADWPMPRTLLHGPAHLQLAASGKPDALNLQLALDLADARLEAGPVLNLTTLAWSGPVTLRHPGAPRLLQALGLADAALWVGDGSLALRADLTGKPASLLMQNLDLTAGLMHVSGALGIAAGPVLSGQISAERLPIPLPRPRGTEPLRPLAWLAAMPGLRGSLGIQAGQVLAGPDVLLREASATLVFGDRNLRVDGIAGAVGTGRFAGAVALDAAQEPPRVHAEGRVSGLTLSGPLFGLPLDLSAGTLDARASLDAAGHSSSALLATLGGEVGLDLANGRVDGFDLAGLSQALTAQDPASIEPAARAVLAGGQSAASAVHLAGTITQGDLVLTRANLESGAGRVRATGSVDMASRLFDLHLALRAGEAGPELGLLVSGPFAAPHLVPELAALAAWLAQRSLHAEATP